MNSETPWLILPPAELNAMSLDGELWPVATSFCPIDWPLDERTRLAMALANTADAFVLLGVGAAWVWGAMPKPPLSWEVAAHPGRRTSVGVAPRTTIRDVTWNDGDVVTLGYRSCTSRHRTLCDVARYETRTAEADVLHALSNLACDDLSLLEHATSSIARRAHLPYKDRALSRLKAVRCAHKI